ncbi:MAG: hypothetical protein AB8B57_16070 [Congregibacter sp.]
MPILPDKRRVLTLAACALALMLSSPRSFASPEIEGSAFTHPIERLARDSTGTPVSSRPTQNLQHSGFWRDSAGWWASDNTYLNGRLEQKITAFQSIVRLEVQGSDIIETTYRFYPPGASAEYYSQGKVQSDQGVEFASVATMRALNDDQIGPGAVVTVNVSPSIGPQHTQTTTTPLSSTLAIQRITEVESGLETYHTLISMPNRDRRYTAMFGIRTGLETEDVDPGDLRGVAIFSARRISAAEVEMARERFRAMNAVGALVVGDADGNIVVTVLD